MGTSPKALSVRTTVVWCSELNVDQHEKVLTTLGNFVAEVEVLGQGIFRFATLGPARYFGGENTFLQALYEALLQMVGNDQVVRIGTADGLFSASVAANQLKNGSFVVPVGASANFLAGQPTCYLANQELVETLALLGIETLGGLTKLSLKDVVNRFGSVGQRAYQLATGNDLEVLQPTSGQNDDSVAVNFETPINQVDQVVFIVKELAEEMHSKLAKKAIFCALLSIQAETEYGEVLSRQWRQSGFISAKALGAQVRWQLEGWLAKPADQRPHGGITRLTLIPVETSVAEGYQPQLWGEEMLTPAASEALKALKRLSSLLEPASLKLPRWQGGRDFGGQMKLVPLEDVELESPRPHLVSNPDGKPWPNQLPLPAPATIHGRKSVRAWVLDDKARVVSVNARGMLSAVPHLLRVGDETSQWDEIKAWAGPWPLTERWWDHQTQRRYARFQLLTTNNVARLVVLENGHWWAEALYD